jgi:hypothetical protein
MNYFLAFYAYKSKFHNFNLLVSASCPWFQAWILSLHLMKMAGEMQLWLVDEMVEMAHHMVVKVLTGLFSVSCEMQRQWDWVRDHEQLDWY